MVNYRIFHWFNVPVQEVMYCQCSNASECILSIVDNVEFILSFGRGESFNITSSSAAVTVHLSVMLSCLFLNWLEHLSLLSAEYYQSLDRT